MGFELMTLTHFSSSQPTILIVSFNKQFVDMKVMKQQQVMMQSSQLSKQEGWGIRRGVHRNEWRAQTKEHARVCMCAHMASSMSGCKQSLTMATQLWLCPSLTQMTGLIGGNTLGKTTKQSPTNKKQARAFLSLPFCLLQMWRRVQLWWPFSNSGRSDVSASQSSSGGGD